MTSPARADGLAVTAYERSAGVHPPLAFSDYASTRLRAPSRPLVWLAHGQTELSGPVFGHDRVQPVDADLTTNARTSADAEAVGQRIRVHGRVLDSDNRPVTDSLVEVWQANAAGRYRHAVDTWPAPLDPNFSGLGRVFTDSAGHYEFVTIRPGAYPWGNHPNAWRPAHIHFSLFGRAFTQRLVTQMYFPDDPLFFQDPIFLSVPDPAARQRMVCHYDHAATEDHRLLGFAFDIVLRGSAATPFESPGATR